MRSSLSPPKQWETVIWRLIYEELGGEIGFEKMKLLNFYTVQSSFKFKCGSESLMGCPKGLNVFCACNFSLKLHVIGRTLMQVNITISQLVTHFISFLVCSKFSFVKLLLCFYEVKILYVQVQQRKCILTSSQTSC